MRKLLPGLRQLRLRISNVFLIDGGPGDRWLVDTGHVLERPLVLAQLRLAGIRPPDLTGILLTHRHSDHAGNAAWFQQRFGVRVYAHRADAQVLDGTTPRPVMKAPGRHPIDHLFAAIENLFPAGRLRIERALEAGDTLAGLEVHHAPGHTDGSVFYRHDATRSLFSGDMILTAIPPLTIRRGLTFAYPAFTTDMNQAKATVQRFHARQIDYDNLLAGHGPALLGGARDRVLRALESAR